MALSGSRCRRRLGRALAVRACGREGARRRREIDPRFLSDLRQPNVEVRRCDFTRDDVEPASYDLVHSRLLLMHLSDPAEVLRRMAAALRPGGWLVAEEPDNAVAESVDPGHPLSEVFDSCNRKRIEFTSAAGITDCASARSCLPTWRLSGSSRWGMRA